MIKSVRCQSCGAPHDIDASFTRMLACEYCGAVSKLEGNSLTVVGNSTKISTGNGLFQLGKRGKLKGVEFRVLGCVRYHHEVGIWDEWQLLLDSRSVWLQQDEGELTLFEEEKLITEFPQFSELSAGISVLVDGKSMFVGEIGEAVVAGMAGQIPRDTAVGQGFFYVDGLADGKSLSLEYYFSEVSLSIGRSLERSDIVMLE